MIHCSLFLTVVDCRLSLSHGLSHGKRDVYTTKFYTRTEEPEKGRGLNFTLFDVRKKEKMNYFETERFRLTFHYEDLCLTLYLP